MAKVFDKMKNYFFDDPEQDDLMGAEDEASDQVTLPEFDKPHRAEQKAAESPKRSSAKVVSMNSTPVQSVPAAGSSKMIIYKPLSYEDGQNIVDNLCARKPVIVNMVDLDREIAQRVVDFIAGAVYAQNGSIRKVSYGIFVIVPSNVSLVGNTDGESEDSDY